MAKTNISKEVNTIEKRMNKKIDTLTKETKDKIAQDIIIQLKAHVDTRIDKIRKGIHGNFEKQNTIMNKRIAPIEEEIIATKAQLNNKKVEDKINILQKELGEIKAQNLELKGLTKRLLFDKSGEMVHATVTTT